MTLLASHLGQISASAKTIAELEFPPPKLFTNALLNNHEITTLIRDTEPHERALFSLDPNAISSTRPRKNGPSSGLDTILHVRKNSVATMRSVKQSAVSRVLGNDMLREIRQSSNTRAHGGIDVEVLLRGAEKLCDVYNVAGAPDKARALRSRHKEVATSLSALEDKVSKQQSVIDRKNSTFKSEDAEDEDGAELDLMNNNDPVVYTEHDFRVEEDEIRDLEARKKALEDRVSGMERDLGGLLK